jgi:predicted  nucleic acid-binding Zn-ribbon protein
MFCCISAEREDGRLNAEKRRIAADIADLQEKMNSHENNIFRITQRIEQMKQQMKWDQEALDEWITVAAKKDDDAMVLQKYTRIDDSKAKVKMTLNCQPQVILERCISSGPFTFVLN